MLLSFFILLCPSLSPCSLFFFFNATPTTEIYTLSLHDALPICLCVSFWHSVACASAADWPQWRGGARQDRKSTRLNSSHMSNSYAVFCLKKKKKKKKKNTNKKKKKQHDRNTQHHITTHKLQ